MCYNLGMKKAVPASVTMGAPQRLSEALAAIGYHVELMISRADTATIDPGSDPGPTDAPIDASAQGQIRATLAAYAVTDRPPAGPKFKAPRK